MATETAQGLDIKRLGEDFGRAVIQDLRRSGRTSFSRICLVGNCDHSLEIGREMSNYFLKEYETCSNTDTKLKGLLTRLVNTPLDITAESEKKEGEYRINVLEATRLYANGGRLEL